MLLAGGECPSVLAEGRFRCLWVGLYGAGTLVRVCTPGDRRSMGSYALSVSTSADILQAQVCGLVAPYKERYPDAVVFLLLPLLCGLPFYSSPEMV